jgi:DNA polymerase-1
VPLDEGIADFAVRDPDPTKLMPFLQSMEFFALLRRAAPKLGVADEVLAAQGAPAVSPPHAEMKPQAAPPPEDKAGPGVVRDHALLLRPIDHGAYECIADAAALDSWIAAAQEAGLLGISIETDHADPMRARILGIALAVGAGIAGYIPLAHRADGGLTLRVPQPCNSASARR